MKAMTAALAVALAASTAGFAHADPSHSQPAQGKKHADQEVKRVHEQYQAEPAHKDMERERATEQESERSRQTQKTRAEQEHKMKTEQERKELGNGSEQGQKQREEKRHKWWKFWD